MQQRGVFAIEPVLGARQHLEDHLHVRGPGYRVGDDLVVVEVNHGRKVELGAAHLEFGDVGHQLGHRALRLDVCSQISVDVLDAPYGDAGQVHFDDGLFHVGLVPLAALDDRRGEAHALELRHL